MEDLKVKKNSNPVETDEFLTSFVNTGAQGIESFADGVQAGDIPDFFDEAISWKAAIDGLSKGFPREAAQITPSEIEALFETKKERLLAAGLNPMLTGSIITNLKGIYYAYATVVQSKQPIVKRA